MLIHFAQLIAEGVVEESTVQKKKKKEQTDSSKRMMLSHLLGEKGRRIALRVIERLAAADSKAAADKLVLPISMEDVAWLEGSFFLTCCVLSICRMAVGRSLDWSPLKMRCPGLPPAWERGTLLAGVRCQQLEKSWLADGDAERKKRLVVLDYIGVLKDPATETRLWKEAASATALKTWDLDGCKWHLTAIELMPLAAHCTRLLPPRTHCTPSPPTSPVLLRCGVHAEGTGGGAE